MLEPIKPAALKDSSELPEFCLETISLCSDYHNTGLEVITRNSLSSTADKEYV